MSDNSPRRSTEPNDSDVWRFTERTEDMTNQRSQLRRQERDTSFGARALTELLEGAELFRSRDVEPIVTFFGSARVADDHELYRLALDLAAVLATRGWQIISGAGPGIMEAAARGAGAKNTFGVNIDLPYEQQANPYIDAETRMVAMSFFFTRKVTMTRPSRAFVVFPGGLGTLDELFEILTLLATGKSPLVPIILVEGASGQYWSAWRDFVASHLVATDFLDEPGLELFDLATTVDEAVELIEVFYSNFVAFEASGEIGRLYLRHDPTDDLVGELERLVPHVDGPAQWRHDEMRVLSCHFEGRRYDLIRRAINVVNRWTL